METLNLTPELRAHVPCQCTRIITNDTPATQRFCFCQDCDCTPENNRVICENCAFVCHRDHDICYAGTGPCVCSCANCSIKTPTTEIQFDDDTVPVLPTEIPPNKCTFVTTKANFYLQHSYRCETCHQKPGEGVCVVCARICHSGHKLIDSGINPFYCDCGSDGIKDCKCLCINDGDLKDDKVINLPFELPFKCTKTFTNDKIYNQRGFACKTCNITEENPICEVCAVKCHSGHDLVDLRLKGFVCKCAECKAQDDTKETFVPALCAEEPPEDCCCGCCCGYEEEEGHEHHCHCHGGCGGHGSCDGHGGCCGGHCHDHH